MDPQTGPELLVVALAAGLAVLAVVVLVLARRTAALDRRIVRLTRGSDGETLEAILASHLERVHQTVRDVNVLDLRSTALEGAQRKAIQRVGLVRFNPFEDAGGNMSFALALLDADGDGLLVSSLHARSGTRIYAKSVARGRPEAALSDEEEAALRQALATGPTGRG